MSRNLTGLTSGAIARQAAGQMAARRVPGAVRRGGSGGRRGG